MSNSSYCPTCGAPVQPSDTACAYCGAALQRQPAPQPAAPQQAAPQSYAPQPTVPQQGAPQSYAPQPTAQNWQQPMTQSWVPPMPYQQASVPAGLSKDQFLSQHFPAFRKNLRKVAILCYFCVIFNAIICLISANPLGLVDSALLLGFTLGMHLGRSKVCAILVLLLAIFEMVIGLILTGGLTSWLWLIAGLWALSVFSNADKQYKSYLAGTFVPTV